MRGWDGAPIHATRLSAECGCHSGRVWFIVGMRVVGSSKGLLGLSLLFGILRAWAAPLSVVDLSGTWAFTPQGGSATTIQVPGGGWYKQGFTTITQADYQRTITVPDSGQAQVTRLEFGAVNYEAAVYVDNSPVGTNLTAFTPSCFDLTGFVTPGQTHTLKVTVKGRKAFMVNGKSTVPNAAGWSANTPQGIFRSARLAVYPQVAISDTFVRPSVASNCLYYDVWVTNGSATPKNLTLSGNLTSWNGDSWVYPAISNQAISVAAGSVSKVTVGPLAWNLGSASYWWPNVPYQSGYTAKLHQLNLVLKQGATTNDTQAVRFGFRETVQKSDGSNTCYLLNGVRVNFRGDSLQGADYDSINSGGGLGDAFDTLPGFLSGSNGWAQAVDNYQRLNFNFVRLHQEPVSPAMLDTCDEKGLMVMEETAIRGSNNDQDFVLGHDNMVSHLQALFRRDRNHPAIVRQSLSNEPGGGSPTLTQFALDLYNAAMAVDGTRPLSIDNNGGDNYDTITQGNFSVFQHYGDGLGQYTEKVWARPDRPYGQGEFVWYADNTRQGFTWFATGTQAMRRQGASDIRPYTLLSAWAGFVPGVNTTDMILEQGGHALYGADNLANPWTNSQILRVQAGFNPVLVADRDYWDANKLSDAAGAWPANVMVLRPNKPAVRNLVVYNDTFSGTAVDVFWELRAGSPTGALSASGELHPNIPLGYIYNNAINFMVPDAADGARFFLVLYSKKAGVELFRETAEGFVISQDAQLAGVPFGATPAYSAGAEFDKACDGNAGTFYDYANANGGYTGIDLGAGNLTKISAIVFTPRSGYESRMAGGVFQGSVDGTNYTTLYTVPATPSPNTRVVITNQTAWRFLRYVGPAGSYCNIAEMAFYHAASAWPWSGSDIGTVGATGISSQIGDTITVAGSGADVFGNNDGFQFAWQAIRGDCDIRAQVTSLTGADQYSKAGVMIRETLDADAKHMSTFLTASNGVQSIWRTNTAGTSFNVNATGIAAPVWVRVVRSGNSFTSYRSPEGTNWTPVGGAQTIAMGTNIYAGLAVTSKKVGTLSVGFFNGVTIITNHISISLAGNPPATNGVVINWSLAGSTNGISLYRATNLTPPVVWAAVTNSPVLSNNQWSVAVSADSGAGFYRLNTVN